jgi:hypothetical protein
MALVVWAREPGLSVVLRSGSAARAALRSSLSRGQAIPVQPCELAPKVNETAPKVGRLGEAVPLVLVAVLTNNGLCWQC